MLKVRKMEQDIRWLQRLENYSKALRKLEEAVERRIQKISCHRDYRKPSLDRFNPNSQYHISYL